ncbi:hypothetical protein DVS77_03635 [Mycolicibacterium moriokaense]|nr:hypothetical protein DVS77_03635 [Mycolicibacterium moriokaense]
MKTIALATLTAAALAVPALVMAGPAAAFPNAGTAEDTVTDLESEGYKVELNGSTNNVALSRCQVTGMHPTLPDSATLAEKQSTTVFVDIACPSH